MLHLFWRENSALPPKNKIFLPIIREMIDRLTRLDLPARIKVEELFEKYVVGIGYVNGSTNIRNQNDNVSVSEDVEEEEEEAKTKTKSKK